MHRLQPPGMLEWPGIQRAQAACLDELRRYRFVLCIVTCDEHVERMTGDLARHQRSCQVSRQSSIRPEALLAEPQMMNRVAVAPTALVSVAADPRR